MIVGYDMQSTYVYIFICINIRVGINYPGLIRRGRGRSHKGEGGLILMRS